VPSRQEVIIMPRPRTHASPAAKQAAYRTRLRDTTTRVDRAALDHLHTKLETLQEVIHAAARQGDPLAQRCRAGSTDTTLDTLITAFQERPAQSPPTAPLKRKQVGPK
jgi:hypothetical protein